jgi:hypothetical protein
MILTRKKPIAYDDYDSAESAESAESVVDLGRTFWCDVIAKGIKTMVHGETPLKMGCELSQSCRKVVAKWRQSGGKVVAKWWGCSPHACW